MASNQTDAPRIEFPCPDYPVKIMGVSCTEFREYVLSTVEVHAPGFDATRIKVKESNKGTFESITVLITATGENQLRDLNTALRASDLVKMVL
ncbi:MAG: DUF493 domain-containing protein [Pseudomonadales bacterium]